MAIAEALAPLVRPNYRVDVKQRAYLSAMTPDDLVGQPDVLLLATREPRVVYETSVAPAAGRGLMSVNCRTLRRVKERYLEIRSVADGEVVTVIELLSHSNKSSSGAASAMSASVWLCWRA